MDLPAFLLEPINSIQQTRDGNALLISTLDSTIRLFDKGNGQLLQSYQGHSNQNYRIRSTLAFADAAVIGGSEDGCLYVWDLLDGTVLEKLRAHGGKIVSSVTWNSAVGKKEWASAGSDGKGRLLFCHISWNVHERFDAVFAADKQVRSVEIV